MNRHNWTTEVKYILQISKIHNFVLLFPKMEVKIGQKMQKYYGIYHKQQKIKKERENNAVNDGITI
jgi:hypothetical protein